jgi:hypothetical protein
MLKFASPRTFQTKYADLSVLKNAQFQTNASNAMLIMIPKIMSFAINQLPLIVMTVILVPLILAILQLVVSTNLFLLQLASNAQKIPIAQPMQSITTLIQFA